MNEAGTLLFPLQQFGDEVRTKKEENTHAEPADIGDGGFDDREQVAPHGRLLCWEDGQVVVSEYYEEGKESENVEFRSIESICRIRTSSLWDRFRR